MHDEVISYGSPLNETLKSLSDKYIFKTIYMVLSTIMRLKLDFDDHEETLQRVANISSKLYYRMEDTSENKKWVKDVLASMYNNVNLSKFLDGLRNPFQGEYNSKGNDDTHMMSRLNKNIVRANTIWYKGSERTIASVFYHKIASLSKSDEMKDLLEKEFEKLVDWFSKFSEK